MTLLPLLAAAKKIPMAFLESLKVKEVNNQISIHYGQGNRSRLRLGLSSKDGFRWIGQGSLVPYGVWRIKKTELVFCEGESDAWTLWFHGYNALGFPGSSMFKLLELKYLQGIPRICIWQEPDKGGETFVSGILKRLSEIGYRGTVATVSLEGFKDPSDLHVKDPERFKKIFRYLIASAEPIKLKPIEKKPMKKLFIENPGRVTEDQIKRASDYPLEEILDIKRGSYTHCPFHDDNRPSMWVKTYGYCFVCSKAMNSIDYLRREMGLSFSQAVRSLQ